MASLDRLAGGSRRTAAPAGVPASQIQGRSPWYLAWLRLRRNKVALACAVLFVLIVLFCLAAPLWAEHVAHTGPNENHLTDKVLIDGEETDVVSPDGTPMGPGLHGRFLLGADQNGRDVMVRLMYGGRTSIYVGLAAAAVTTVLAVIVALLAGYYRGWIDAVLSRGDGRDLGVSRAAARHRVGHHAVDRRPQGRSHRRSPATRSGSRS